MLLILLGWNSARQRRKSGRPLDLASKSKEAKKKKGKNRKEENMEKKNRKCAFVKLLDIRCQCQILYSSLVFRSLQMVFYH